MKWHQEVERYRGYLFRLFNGPSVPGLSRRQRLVTWGYCRGGVVRVQWINPY